MLIELQDSGPQKKSTGATLKRSRFPAKLVGAIVPRDPEKASINES